MSAWLLAAAAGHIDANGSTDSLKIVVHYTEGSLCIVRKLHAATSTDLVSDASNQFRTVRGCKTSQVLQLPFARMLMRCDWACSHQQPFV